MVDARLLTMLNIFALFGVAGRLFYFSPLYTEVLKGPYDEDLIEREDMVVTVTAGGYIKRTPLAEFRAQKRGGKGVSGGSLKEDDVVTQLFVTVPIANPVLVFTMLVFGGGTLAVMGLIAGILANKFDHLAAFQNFFIMPLSFLSGVFYSIHSLPEFWQHASRFNPVFYMIDGFRQGFFGVGDSDPLRSVIVAGVFFVLVSSICITMLSRGYKIRG